MNNTVGVVVPTYNCREYLEDCIESLLGQSHGPSQIVICDDHSQDNTQEFILRYQMEYPDLIESILHTENKGIAKNFNSGLGKIRTDYISIISGDDFWHSDKLKLEVEALSANPECRWAYSDSVITDKEGNHLGPFRREYDGAEGQILFEILTHEMTLRNWLIEKSLFDSVGFFDENFFIFEDWDFKIRLAECASVKHVSHDSVFYRTHGQGISSSPGNIYFENLMKVYKKHFSLIETLPDETKSVIIRKQREDMLIQLNRYLNSNSKISYSNILKYFFYKIYFRLFSV
jgi:glycosyltransferase involved in cell wall biosynthesis